MPTKKGSKKIKKVQEEVSAFDLPKTSETHETVSHPHRTKKKLYLLIGILLIIVVILGLGVYYLLQYQKNQQIVKNPLLASESEQETIVQKVSLLTQLPSNEIPTIAEVSDITKLQKQPFFKNAQNGDMVLIYPKAKEAILYNPSMNRIVNIGPIALNQQSVEGAATAPSLPVAALPSTTPVTVALYNGTTITGLTKKIQAELVQEMPGVTVVENTNASKQDYIKTTIVDLTGKESAAASQLASILHGSVGSLPTGELGPTNSNTDIVVILGKSY